MFNVISDGILTILSMVGYFIDEIFVSYPVLTTLCFLGLGISFLFFVFNFIRSII